MIAAALLIVWVSDKAVSTVMELGAIWQSVGGIVLAIYILGVTNSRIRTKWLMISAVAAFVLLLIGIVEFYYTRAEDQRVSFLIVGNIGLLSTLLIGYAGVFVSRYITNPKQKDQYPGLTLWTIDRDKIK
jgi:uncharacterized membrane protein